jgi:hypothetical protein
VHAALSISRFKVTEFVKKGQHWKKREYLVEAHPGNPLTLKDLGSLVQSTTFSSNGSSSAIDRFEQSQSQSKSESSAVPGNGEYKALCGNKKAFHWSS